MHPRREALVPGIYSNPNPSVAVKILESLEVKDNTRCFCQFKAEDAESEISQRRNSAWRQCDLLPEASARAVPSAGKISLQVWGSFLLSFLPVSFHVS